MGNVFTFVQVLQNAFVDGRIGVNDVADDLQLFALDMVFYSEHQRHLFLPFFAHFVIGSFSNSVVILVVWLHSICYSRKTKATAECAFFLNYS